MNQQQVPVNYYIGLEENIRMPFKDRFLDGRNGAVANRPSKQASKQAAVTGVAQAGEK